MKHYSKAERLILKWDMPNIGHTIQFSVANKHTNGLAPQRAQAGTPDWHDAP